MKKLNTIFSFVLLSFCLLINVSYASFTEDTPIPWGANWSVGDASNGSIQLGDYTLAQVKSIVNSWKNNSNDDSYYQAFLSMANNLKSNGFNTLVTEGDFNGVSYYHCAVIEDTVDVAINDSWILFSSFSSGDLRGYVYYSSPFSDYYYKQRASFGSADRINAFPTSVIYSNVNIKNTIWTSGLIWDGTYYYEVPTTPDEPETPTMPTNAEIASAVQMFYDSDYYKNNNDFDKFIVLYDNTTKLYLFIGHTVPEFLQQVIIPPHFRYQQYIFDVQWWKFDLHENSGGPSYGTPYYLYAIDNKLENLEYRGKSTIGALVESGPWATSNTIIVYSNYDYLVRTYVLDEETGDYVYTDGTIQGDQYTYDENLDITDNQYNPLDNFVTVDYPSTLAGNADFDSFLNTFNENKDVLILPQNSNWVILANTSLFSYFGSFIIMCTLFIIIERIMRG